MVVETPADGTHAYRVQFPDGSVVSLTRREFTIRVQYQMEGIDAVLAEYDLYDYVIYRCIVGSRAYGLSHDASDTDYRGIYLPPAELHWSLTGVPEQLESAETEEAYWELQKFLLLALKANPNILECLYTPLVELATPLAQELLAMRECFLSKLIYQTYNGYVLGQFKKLEQDMRARGEIKWKHAMHLIRLLISGVTALKEGYILVRARTNIAMPAHHPPRRNAVGRTERLAAGAAPGIRCRLCDDPPAGKAGLCAGERVFDEGAAEYGGGMFMTFSHVSVPHYEPALASLFLPYT